MIEELKPNTGSLFFWGCYLYELGLSQEERNRLGLPPLTDAEKAFVLNAKKRMEEQKELQKTYHDDDKFVTLRVPLKIAAPGWGENFKKPVFPHVDIPKKEQYAFNKEKSAEEKLVEAIESEIIAFGGKHGFPVIYVITEQDVLPMTVIGGNVVRGGKLNLFKTSEMRKAERIAEKYNGTIGICKDPAEKYIDELNPQPVLDGPLPKFCKAHHCTKRNKACNKCAYTALSSSERGIMEA